MLAPNASPMTLDGTNTWVLREPGGGRSVVIDPGPPTPATSTRSGRRPATWLSVLLTHHHLDHSEAAREFAESVGCGVRALDPAYRLGDEGLGEGDVVEVDGLEVHVVATPGHTADSLSFLLPAERVVLTGDTVLGRGTSVVAHPDGRLGAYLDSLDRLHALAEAREVASIWPGHGPVIDDALAGPRPLHLPPPGAARAGRRRGTSAPDRRRRRCRDPAAPGRRDRVRRRRPGPLGRRRALRPRPARLPHRLSCASVEVSGRGGRGVRRPSGRQSGARGGASRGRRSRPAPC